MQGLGNKLKKRAQELGISNAEVGRRAGLSEVRYGNYIRDQREPDLDTLVRICGILEMTPNDLLISTDAGSSKRDKLRNKLLAESHGLNDSDLKLAASLVRTLSQSRAK